MNIIPYQQSDCRITEVVFKYESFSQKGVVSKTINFSI